MPYIQRDERGVVIGQYAVEQPGFAEEWSDEPLLGPEPEPERRYSFREFMALFTREEQRAIARAAMSDVEMKLLYDDAMGAAFILLGDPATQAGLAAFVAAGLITADRRDAVLAGTAPSR